MYPKICILLYVGFFEYKRSPAMKESQKKKTRAPTPEVLTLGFRFALVLIFSCWRFLGFVSRALVAALQKSGKRESLIIYSIREYI